MKKFSTKKVLAVLAAVTAVGCGVMFAACGETEGEKKTDEVKVDLNENFSASDVYGMWSYSFQDDEDNRVGYSTVLKGDQMTSVQESKLVLMNFTGETYRNEANKYNWKQGNNYELVKNLYNSETGLYIWQVYFGTFTVNESNRTVTLAIPDYYSYYVFFGNCATINGTMFKDQGGTHLLTSENEYYTSNGESGSRDGLYDFNAELAEYHHSTNGLTPITLQLDLNTKGFTYFNADDE
ncbi:MAG: hypothetical protein J6D37_07285 [Clostridia bacterium]|nr:hypothetical protein [Clostridia bacterium]